LSALAQFWFWFILLILVAVAMFALGMAIANQSKTPTLAFDFRMIFKGRVSLRLDMRGHFPLSYSLFLVTPLD
jgi:hypothetical protein